MALESIEFTAQSAPGDYLLTGVLTFATASAALQAADGLFRSERLRFDLSGVRRADSSGVGLLIEWWRRAQSVGCQLHFANIPESLLAMLRVGGIEGLLPIDPATASLTPRYNLKQETT